MIFGIELRKRRLEAGLSQQDLADLIHYDRSRVSQAENSYGTPSLQFAQRCDRVLHAGGTLVALASADETGAKLQLSGDGWGREDIRALEAMLSGAHGTPDAEEARRTAHEWLVNDPPQVIELRSGRRVGAGMVSTIRARTAELRRLDDQMGGADLLATVTKELMDTVALMREASFTEDVGRAMLAAVGYLAQIAGWVAADAGRYDVAARYYLGGAHAAHAGGDAALVANILSLLSYQTASTGDPRTAVLIARSAHVGAWRAATPAVRVLVGERVAWAHAIAGDRSHCDGALAEVDELFGDVDPAAEPDWAYWLDRDEVDIMAGRCYTELARPMKAVPLLAPTLDRYSAGSAREAALYTTWLADSYLHAHEIDEAAEAAGRALELSTPVNSPRVRSRVSAVRSRLRPYRTVHSVREFEERYKATTSTYRHE